MPDNPMTDILRDFRSYRPANHNEWLTWVDQSAQAVEFANYCESNPVSLALYIQLLDQVRDFRARHWLFAKEYIIKRSAHPVATGGSPMATWLPNQLNAVLEKILERVSVFDQNFGRNADRVDYSIMDSIKAKATEQRGLLQKDVSDYVKKYSTTTNSY